MCQSQIQKKRIDTLLENINDAYMALQNIRVNDSESRQLREDAIISIVIVRATLVQLGIDKNQERRNVHDEKHSP